MNGDVLVCDADVAQPRICVPAVFTVMDDLEKSLAKTFGAFISSPAQVRA